MSITATTTTTAAAATGTDSDTGPVPAATAAPASAGAAPTPTTPTAPTPVPAGAAVGSGVDDDARSSIIKPRPGTEPELREACAIDLDKPKPENARAARVWVAGNEKRKADRRRDQAIATLDAAWSDYVAHARGERDANHLAAAKMLAAKGVDLNKLMELAAKGRLPDDVLRGE